MTFLKQWRAAELALIFLVFASPGLRAEVIEFPQEELATESVLPKFDQPTATKKRTVPTTKRFEVGAHVGSSLSDAFFNIFPIGISAAYHFNEVSAFELRSELYMNSVTSYKDQLAIDTTGTTNGVTQARLNRNPASKYSVMGGYEFTPYYGKISITKSKVINLSIVADLDVGMITFEDGTTPVLGLGLGEKFYFSPNWGLRADLRTMTYNGTDVIYDQLEKRIFTNVLVTIGFLYFFPSVTR